MTVAKPPVTRLPPVTFPVALTVLAVVTAPEILAVPVILAPVEVNTATFEVPPTLILALPLGMGIPRLVVPLFNAVAERLPASVVVPDTVRFPVTVTVPPCRVITSDAVTVCMVRLPSTRLKVDIQSSFVLFIRFKKSAMGM